MTLESDPHHDPYSADDGADIHLPADVLDRLLDRLQECCGPDEEDGFAEDLADLRRWLESLPVIEQAKGILMARYLIDADTAFQVLKRWSSHHNIKIRTISRQLTAAATQAGPDAGPPGEGSLDQVLAVLEGPAADPE